MSVLNVGSLEISVLERGTSIHIVWKGEADERDPRKVILPCLETVAAQAARSRKEVVLDFTDLQFMNSSCIGIAISFLKSLQKAHVRASVHYNTRHDWQILSLQCTRTIFSRSEYVTIRDHASAFHE